MDYKKDDTSEIRASCLEVGELITIREPGVPVKYVSVEAVTDWLEERLNIARHSDRVLSESRFKSDYMQLEIERVRGQADALQEVISYLALQ